MSLIGRRWLGASLACITIASLAQPALAQEGQANDAQPPPAGTAESDDQLDIIYVRANRRVENLQDVAVSGATLESERVQSIFDAGGDTTALAARVPGL
ncbi:MAG TPA: hypothetical protein VJS15_01365, partial [Allosphingosinicella sp.]|nr:hypothetical protein [Allosphingosinicella sp.]